MQPFAFLNQSRKGWEVSKFELKERDMQAATCSSFSSGVSTVNERLATDFNL
jgi:hypothetical protein